MKSVPLRMFSIKVYQKRHGFPVRPYGFLSGDLGHQCDVPTKETETSEDTGGRK